jgi:thiamine biosynthesis protein ThiI
VRFGGEIGIKSEWTRRVYEKLIVKNIKNVVSYFDLTYEEMVRRRGRIYVMAEEPQGIAAALTRVFGISSVSVAKKASSDLEKMMETVIEAAETTIADRSTFAVRCRRVGTHGYSSVDVCREAGTRIQAALKNRAPVVNLTRPQHTVNIEIREDEAYVFTDTLPGVGGFPVGSQGKLVCLLSGGIDSPVAAWLAMKRGCPITPIYMDNAPLTDETTRNKALETARKLFEWSIGYPRKVYIVPHGKNLERFMQEAPKRFTCLLCKRMMYRIAERIADIEGAEGIVTGEAIGEQASQTITNLRVLDEAATSYPIHRPLLGFDKTETEALARKIGTFQISTQKAKGCTAAPDQPATCAKLQMVKEAEEKLDIKQMVDESVNAARTITV